MRAALIAFLSVAGCSHDPLGPAQPPPDLAMSLDLAAAPDLAMSACPACPACKADEVCCGMGGDCQFAPVCAKRCKTSDDCGFGGPCVQLYDEPCGPICLGSVGGLCPGVPKTKPGSCAVCDAFLAGDRTICLSSDTKSRPIEDRDRRLCGFRIDACPNCRPAANGGVTCGP